MNADGMLAACLSATSENDILDNAINTANLFCYCNNDAVNNTDPGGYIAGIDDVVVWGLFGLFTLTCVICAWMSTPQFKQAWTDFCNAVGNGLSSIWSNICSGASAVWNWSANKIKKAVSAVKKFNTVAKASNKIKSKLKNERKKSQRYYVIKFDGNGKPILCGKLSAQQAISKLKQGNDVITYYKSDAKYAANKAGSISSKCDQKHGGAGFFNHYHVKSKTVKYSIHSFFVSGG